MINSDAFIRWVEEHFDKIERHGDEVKVNSIFAEDNKCHLWCNPVKNAYHCWKTESHGNLYNLVAQVSKCSYQEAVSLLSDDNELRQLEERLDKFFNSKPEINTISPPCLVLPSNTFAITKLDGRYKNIVESYLNKRHINVGNLMFCIAGEYAHRIIIPYYNAKNELVYWNSRDITGKSKLRYQGPDFKLTGVGKGDVIYMSAWPIRDSKIYLTEGEFDAMSLSQCGVVGAACGGKELSDRQIEILRMYKICICFDTDKSGEVALNKIGDKLIKSGMHNVSYIRPPVDKRNAGTKMDWNRMLVEFGEKVVSLYINVKERPFTQWTSTSLRFNNR